MFIEVINSAKDIFWLVFAFCILWLTLFFSLMLYYVIKMMRQMTEISGRVSETVNMIHGMVKSVKDKSENLATYVTAIVKSSDQLKQLFGKKTTKKRSSKK